MPATICSATSPSMVSGFVSGSGSACKRETDPRNNDRPRRRREILMAASSAAIPKRQASSQFPSSKHQNPNKIQEQNSKCQTNERAVLVLGVWCLEFVWSLELGAWSLCFLLELGACAFWRGATKLSDRTLV